MNSINNTLFVGKVLLELQHCPSTNNHAKELLSKSRPIEGTAIFTSNQTHGKGQFGKIWESEAWKNIAISFILYPSFLNAQHHFELNQAISLAVRSFCQEQTSQPVRIKWPNDIYVQNRKLGGILIENQILQGRIESSIVGIGINVNQTEFSSSLPNPVSMKLLTNRHFDIKSIIPSLCSHIEQIYLQLKAGNFLQQQLSYRKALYHYNQQTTFRTGNEKFEGKIRQVDEQGRLVVDTQSGRKTFSFGEIQWADQ